MPLVEPPLSPSPLLPKLWRWTSSRWTLFALTWGVLALGILRLLAPLLRDFSTFGFHDWDLTSAYRYITVVSIKDYGVPPWWHPWFCGGFAGFGHVEGAPNFMSPYLPLYLLTDIRTATRLEVLGCTLTGAAGCWALARNFTRSHALAGFFAALFVLNGRWGLQVATGHCWHLQFCWTPWVFFFFERAQRPGQLFSAVWSGLFLALIVCAGGIYPLPYTALMIACYAFLLSGFTRSLRPLGVASILVPVAIGLSAPKLFAVMDTMSQSPRLIASPEVIGIAELLVMLTDHSQTYGTFPVRVPAYNWHEWGIYIGAIPLVCLGLGVLFARGGREHSLKILGLLCLFLGLGAFHPAAPWAWLHQWPVFASLHVPSRFHFMMVFFLTLVFVAWAGKWFDPLLTRQPWLDYLGLVGLLALVLDLSQVAARPLAQAFWMRKPATIERQPLFEHRTDPSVQYQEPDWAPPTLLPMMANTGVIRCYGVPQDFVPGALGADNPSYRGRAYLADGPGQAEVVEWNPNRALVKITGAQAGARVVYNMNWDPSWRANGSVAEQYHHQVATLLPAGVSQVEFRYSPRTLPWSMTLFLTTVAVSFGTPWFWRRRSALASSRFGLFRWLSQKAPRGGTSGERTQ